VTAHLFTILRLLLVVPAGLAFGRPQSSWARWAVAIVALGIATDIVDGRIARRLGSQSSFGQIFDHTTDFLFVTVGLTGTSLSHATTPFLPIFIVLAFAQYVLDSRFLHRSPALRMNWLGRRNGIFYFAPLCMVAVARAVPASRAGPPLLSTACFLSYALVASTLLSRVDRALASGRART
jgi:phosphatidylglycerophosphate synthase